MQRPLIEPHIRTYDSSRTPKRGERISTPRTLAEVDLSAITAALVEARAPGPDRDVAAGGSRRKLTELEHQITERNRLLTAAQARIAALEAEATSLRVRLSRIASLAAEPAPPSPAAGDAVHPFLPSPSAPEDLPSVPVAQSEAERASAEADGNGALHPAARKLLAALAPHAPARFTWGQAATLAGLKPSGGHYNAGRKQLRDMGLVDEAADLVAVSPAGMDLAGEVPPAPSTAEERLALWFSRCPARHPKCCVSSRPTVSAMSNHQNWQSRSAKRQPAATGTAESPCSATMGWSS